MTRKNSIYFASALFITIVGFVVFIARMEFGGQDEDINKKLMDSSTQNTTAAKTIPATSAVAGQETAVQAPTNTNAVASPNSSAETSAADTSSTDAPTANSETNMVTGQEYTNNNLGISFNYPEEYKIEEKNGNQVVASKSGVLWKMKVYDNKNKKEIKEWFDDYFPVKNNAGCALGDPTLKLGTYTTKSLKVLLTDGKCEDGGFFALNSDKTRIAKVILEKGTEDDANKILSTFKFTR
jgi:hypothetical protein